ncbi:hypothetical protein THAOC_07615 [Thalassiosira oceanica]|uniref:Uncharacterized protein n=1 Tax=Thalassiosira oceanica TaxID=159749 RepID=K0SX32_THAOC|nr:hypothetical protein THAOC_07615 [Thalassiosira oceanica]|eukprot:EJK70983.1 hypothetical protein THAOC_07615 [Thalassiosira oceanica]
MSIVRDPCHPPLQSFIAPLPTPPTVRGGVRSVEAPRRHPPREVGLIVPQRVRGAVLELSDGPPSPRRERKGGDGARAPTRERGAAGANAPGRGGTPGGEPRDAPSPPPGAPPSGHGPPPGEPRLASDAPPRRTVLGLVGRTHLVLLTGAPARPLPRLGGACVNPPRRSASPPSSVPGTAPGLAPPSRERPLPGREDDPQRPSPRGSPIVCTSGGRESRRRVPHRSAVTTSPCPSR